MSMEYILENIIRVLTVVAVVGIYFGFAIVRDVVTFMACLTHSTILLDMWRALRI